MHEMELTKIIGNIAFFKCPLCPYERTINTKNGKLTRNMDTAIQHFAGIGVKINNIGIDTDDGGAKNEKITNKTN